MDYPVLSVCISSYNHVDNLKNIIRELLRLKRNDFDIIISDDASAVDITEELKAFSDPRLKVYRNSENCGALSNWFQTLQRGDGKYLLHLLDRDEINVGYIPRIIELLSNVEVGFGYIYRNIYFYHCSFFVFHMLHVCGRYVCVVLVLHVLL